MKRFVPGFRTAVAAALAAMAAAPAAAQVREKTSLTLDGARQIIAAATRDARGKTAPGAVIAVVDDGGNLMALERLDGTFPAGAAISIGKARTAALFKKPTAFFEDVIRKGRTPMIALDDFTPLQGGVPIVVGDQVVGAVGVSGAASAQQDEEVALAGAAAIAGPGAEGSGALRVSYWKGPDVAAAFAKGAVLYDGKDGRNYMVHASRRDKPGLAELHALDTDIIYVLQGAATLVTGGTIEQGKATEANEIRGDAIRGGETRTIAPGDVVIVPNGTPHWFKDVAGPLTYYVVKVR
jgi:glc operon protein GlcG